MPQRRQVGRWAALVLAALPLLGTGCLVLAAGAAAGGAAAVGYAYYKGSLYRDFPSSLGDSLAAVRTALVELQFPVLDEKGDTGMATVSSRTGDGTVVHVYLDVVPGRVPADGAQTRVAVRVGAFGDEAISTRILDQISAHLVPNQPSLRPVPVQTSAPPLAAPTPASPQTAPPPLAAPVAAPPQR